MILAAALCLSPVALVHAGGRGNPIGAPGSKFAKQHPRRNEVNKRVANQRARINQGGKGGKLWNAGQPTKSLIITEISGDKPKMPSKGTPVTKDEIDTISKWIMQGAANN